MKLIPSLLEYSQEQLIHKLDLVSKNLGLVKKLEQTQDLIGFHLDFVLPQFAKDRKVMASLGLKTVLDLLQKYFPNSKLHLSMHFMGTIEDLYEINDFLKDQTFNPEWLYTLYVPANFTSTFAYHSKLFSNVSVGIWFDKLQWDDQKISSNLENATNFLLMTVVAGKSGQKLEEAEITKVQAICKNFPETHFLADGGWSLDSDLSLDNLQIVSYTSFWQTFEQNLKLG